MNRASPRARSRTAGGKPRSSHPFPNPRSRGRHRPELVLDEGKGLSTEAQQYDIRSLINELRIQVDRWRALLDPSTWHVTPETARLLQHWRHHRFEGIRPFFCQVEAAETAIWLTEVAPQIGKEGKRFLDHLKAVNDDAVGGDPDRLVSRLALKLATGAGKTTVMAMLIAWQTINAVRHPNSQALHSRLPACDPRDHDQGPPPRFSSRTTPTPTTSPASWFRPTWFANWRRPRSSSPTITPSSSARRSSSPGAGGRSSRGMARRSAPSRPRGRCSSGSALR